MPVKCFAEPSGAAVSLPVDDKQVGLLAFNNREGGSAASSSKRSQKELQQNATSVLLQRGLTLDDLAISSTVAIHTAGAPARVAEWGHRRWQRRPARRTLQALQDGIEA